jgi:hypothetical protein
MYIFDTGRSLTPEEIEAIKHKITPIHLVKGEVSNATTYIDAEREGPPARRLETMDKKF